MVSPFQAPISTYEGWGIDPAYMTPAYMSNFRPSYGGNDDGRNPYAHRNSLGYSAKMAVGAGDIPFGADPMMYAGAHNYNLASAPMDAAMSGLQSVAIPLGSWYAADRLLGRTGIASGLGRRMGSGAAGAAMSTVGRLGSRIPGFSAAAGGLGRLGVGSGLARGAGALGGFAGGVMFPIMAGQALSSGLDSAVIDPYVSTRRGMDAMKANSANQFISGPGGSTTGGFGMSATRAFDISKALTKAGAEDFALKTEDYNKIADFGMRSGMFNEIGDMDTQRIVDTVKKMGKAVKTITAITGNPDIQEAIGTLAKLKAGGIDNVSKMEAAMRQLGSASAISGTSVDQIMNTVGTQGMMMAQQNGLSGDTGLMASADAYAGFTNARKSGLISGAQWGALGGAEGMTQNVMSGAMKAMNNPYGMMTMMSGGNMGQGIKKSIMGWGDRFSQDPMATQGDWQLNKGVYQTQALNRFGAGNLILNTLQAKAKQMGQDANDPRVLAALAPSEGISEQELRSALEANKAENAPNAALRRGGAIDAKARQLIGAKRHQDGTSLAGVWGVGEAQRIYKQLSTSAVSTGAGVGEGPLGVTAQLSDWMDSMVNKTMGIKTADQFKVRKGGSEYSLQGYNRADITHKGADGQPIHDKTEFFKSNKWKKEIGAIMNMATHGTPEQKAKAIQLMDLMKAGNKTPGSTQKVRDLVADLEKTSDGGLFGKHNMLDQSEAVDTFVDKAFTQGEIKVTKDKVATTSQEMASALGRFDVWEGDVPTDTTGLSDEKRTDVISKILQARGDSGTISKLAQTDFKGDEAGVMKLLGMDPTKKFGSAKDKQVAIAKAMKKMSDKDRGDVADEEDLRSRLLLISGGDEDLVNDIIRNQSVDTIMGDVNDVAGGYLNKIGGDVNTTKKLAEKVEEARATRGSQKEGGPTDIDYDKMLDVGKSMAEGFDTVQWGPRMDDNTTAIVNLTKALKEQGINVTAYGNTKGQGVN